MSKRSPSHRAAKATRTCNRQEFRMIMWLRVTVVSAVVMLAASLLSGSIGDRRFYCSLIASSAAIILSVCLVLSFPTLVRMMRAQLDQPGDAGPAIKTFFCIAMIALVATASTVMGGGAFAEGYEDARTGPQTKAVTSCERFRTETERGRRGAIRYYSTFTLHFDDGKSRHFEIRTDTKDEFAQPASPYYALYQACVVRPFTTSIVVDVYPHSGIIKAIREA